MSGKYIIRNCPCLEQSDLDKDIYNSCLGATDYIGMCKDCTDCVMKQIVELCKEESSIMQHKQKIKVKGLNKLADKILELLDIEEVE